jgi:hypothetical protein
MLSPSSLTSNGENIGQTKPDQAKPNTLSDSRQQWHWVSSRSGLQGRTICAPVCLLVLRECLTTDMPGLATHLNFNNPMDSVYGTCYAKCLHLPCNKATASQQHMQANISLLLAATSKGLLCNPTGLATHTNQIVCPIPPWTACHCRPFRENFGNIHLTQPSSSPHCVCPSTTCSSAVPTRSVCSTHHAADLCIPHQLHTASASGERHTTVTQCKCDSKPEQGRSLPHCITHAQAQQRHPAQLQLFAVLLQTKAVH